MRVVDITRPRRLHSPRHGGGATNALPSVRRVPQVRAKPKTMAAALLRLLGLVVLVCSAAVVRGDEASCHLDAEVINFMKLKTVIVKQEKPAQPLGVRLEQRGWR